MPSGPAPAAPAVLPAAEIDAVVFDLGGVFMIPDPARIAAIVAPAGVHVEYDAADGYRAHSAGVRALTELFAGDHGDESDADVWRAYDLAYFATVGLDGDTLARAANARDEYRRSPARVGHVWLQPLTDNIAILPAIAERRPVAIVSNNDGTAADQCLDLGIAQVGAGPHTPVAALVDSGVVGVAKPDPRIFEPALEALGTDPGRTLYVGDTVHADVRGATAAGMPVVQLDPHGFHDDHDHWRLPDLAALVAVLDA